MLTGPIIYPPHPITFEQYMAEEQVKRRYEIVNGVRVFAMPPSFRHQDILGNFLSLLRDYADQHGYTTLYSLFDVLISREPFCTRQPDLMLASKTRLQSHRDGEPLSIAPELVVEILSSVDRELALESKFRDYRVIGVQECWVVRPEDKVVEVLHLASEGGSSIIFTEDEIVTSLLLPKLAITVTDILRLEEPL